MKKYKRRNYLINKSLQLRYIAMVAILMVSIAVVTGWVIYSTTWGILLDELEGKVVLDKVLMDINNLLIVRISLLILAWVCISAILVLFVVHRIAGPLFRAKKTMQLIGEGIVPRKVNFRKKDELKDFAEAINEAISKLEQFREKNSELLASAQSSLKNAMEHLENNSPAADKAIKEIETGKQHIEDLAVFHQAEKF